MSRQGNTKAKLLHIAQILMQESDEEHPISTNELIEKLALRGIYAERKAIYDDIRTLEDFGLDINTVKAKSNLYFIGERTLQLPELKLLVDSAVASRFITESKSRELIKKLGSLTSRHYAKALNRQVFMADSLKSPNEQIYYNVDAIYQALAEEKQISFKYLKWTMDKTREEKHKGEKYIISPLGLAWADNNYYLIGYSREREKILHFRVDKMASISVLSDRSDSPDEDFDILKYTNRTFSMFGGEEEMIELLVHNSLIGVIIDRFGQSTAIIRRDAEHFIANVRVSASPVFLGWVMSFGNKMQILSPKKVVEDIKKLTSEIHEIYK